MMPITVTCLTPAFAARIDGVDISRPLDEPSGPAIRAAFDEHSVLLFRGAALDDETQVAFSLRFGALEVTRSMNPAAGTPFARQSNLDIKTGEVIPAEDRRMVYQLANMLWHSDSSFKPVPSLCSLLTGRIVPPEGGATEFASARAAYPRCRRTWKRRAEARRRRPRLRVVARPGPAGLLHRRGARLYSPVRHRLVRANPVNGRRAPSSWARTPPTSRVCRSTRAARSSGARSITSPSPSSVPARVGGGRPRGSGTTAACSTAPLRTTPSATSASCSGPPSSGDPAEPVAR